MSRSRRSERWAAIRVTAEAALTRPPDARAAFLDTACVGDLALRAEVEAQIDACERAAGSVGFLAEPAAAFAAPLFANPHTADRVEDPARAPPESQPRGWAEDALRAALAGQYDVLREHGRGGMATVYLARDKRHERLVALKVLDPALGAALSAERFLREIRVTAALTHPHILPLHDSGEAAGLLYYVMPFVEGETLRERLARERPLPLDAALRLVREVASALACAHRHGVVHRDIKPANILLEDGHAVVSDFGIARAMRQAQEPDSPARPDGASGAKDCGMTDTLTDAGTSPGTPAYMAPEQARGDATDHRADLYSLGVIAYEALAGVHPFGTRAAQALIAAHRSEMPISLAARNADIPPAVAALVMELLAKDPAARPRDAAAVLQVVGSAGLPPPSRAPLRVLAAIAAAALVSVGAGAYFVSHDAGTLGEAQRSAASRPALLSLAVLPFENSSGDTTFSYLADGIADPVRDALSAIPGLVVKARSASRALSGRHAPEVARTLGVGAVLEGTVSRSQSGLHVTAELVRTSDQVALWSRTFDGEPGRLPGMQDSIARAVTTTLHLRDPALRVTRVASHARGTDDIEAYDLFLQGRYAFDHLDFDRASGRFRAAVARDRRYARAHAFLAMSYANTTTLGLASVDSMDALAGASARRALALDSTVAEAYAAQSFILVNEMHLAEAVRPLERAIRFDPGNAYIVSSYGLALDQVGRVTEGLVQARRARDLDPESSTAKGLLAYSLRLANQYDAAITEMHAALDRDPKNALIHQSLGFTFAFNGMPDSALASFRTAYRMNPEWWGARSTLVFGYAAAGRWQDAARERAAIARDPRGNSPEYERMLAELAYGDYDAAMSALERGIAVREPLLGILSIPCDPLFDPLKPNPRFAALLARLGARACPATRRWPITHRI